MHLDLLIPDLLPPPWPEGGDPSERLSAPALEWLLGHAVTTSLADVSTEHWLCRAHGLTDCPSAPYALLAEGLDPGSSFWLHADPVHLQLNLDKLRVLDARTFRLEAEESAALLAELNSLVEPYGMAAIATRPYRWYLRLAEDPALATPPLSLLAGQDINPRQRLGNNQAFWQKLLNEIQVAFHHLPVNTSRAEAGTLTVSGIWPWGAGQLQTPAQCPYDAIHADLLLARGLALASGVPLHDRPAGATALADARPSLVVLENLAAPARYADSQGWLEAMAQLERNWFAPLAESLRRGRIASLRIVAPRAAGGCLVSLKASDRWKIWRRARKLAACRTYFAPAK